MKQVIIIQVINSGAASPHSILVSLVCSKEPSLKLLRLSKLPRTNSSPILLLPAFEIGHLISAQYKL